ncbi:MULTISPECIES: xanthine dehydrogenase family protein molybdopterin-binding subunit [unclassified Meiothermus]|uniref:xanthine dehydrogenase family protein molybdopterin-binding subunit n=1 Tax=unclassified Meiothermus TaxID=370471 RepID=UPI000D7CB08E|nr:MULTISPECIES: xanthine dehydrogenase family protein molybdopterin-binding subunit [unclassified Meiothermus]PZA05845.1 xanthine dehydrogenase family protein molybdopterin-binding subunit [Meiothermus sp. Pnk-1]RYM40864.1 xanthine dehydrogenase family protein molybdopterin-binding subunit [Meiothermus sp. PNK-Is4]
MSTAAEHKTPSRFIGKPIQRLEDGKFITGKGTYLDDLAPAGTLHLMLVRSLYAHARIKGIDAREALEVPGVLAVYTALDLPELYAPGSGGREAKVVRHPVLAKDYVRYTGQPVAAVVATSRESAQDALQRVYVDYEALEAVTDPLQAMQEGTLVHPELGTNHALQRRTSAGDVAEAFAKAHRVVGARMVQQRLAPSPMEPRGVLAAWDGIRESLTIWSSTQMPHDLRSAIAEALGLAENQVRAVTPDVGGAFGAKINIYPEEVLAAYLTRILGKPVKWVESRSESFVATIHGRAQVADLEMALDAEGKILGLRGRVVADLGAYILETTLGNAPGTILMLQGPYEIPAIDLELVSVYTHATPTGAYRGAGRPEATYYLERLMDMAARELGLDPAEIRLRNLIQGPFPYKTLTGAKYDSGAYPETLRKLLELTDYPALRAEQARARAEGRLLGIGLCVYVEITGYGWETGGVRINPDGSAVVFTGTSPHGQGTGTGFAQIVAERLGIPLERISIVQGDTLAVPFGQGTAGSRTLSVGGSAILNAAEKVAEKVRRIAAHLLEAAPEDIVLTEGGWGVQGTDRAVSLEQVAQAAYNPRKLPPDLEPGLEGQATFNLKEANYPFGAHLALVELDRETGQVRVLRYVALDDVGVVVNPLLVQGQQQGGVAQGLGQALYEGIRYDETGQNQSASLLEYNLPRADQVVWVEAHRGNTPSPTNPLGAKGIGEAGTIGATPTIVNAVMDALGLKHLDMPLTPEKVWRALRQGQG